LEKTGRARWPPQFDAEDSPSARSPSSIEGTH
jgi:hypothetical protein